MAVTSEKTAQTGEVFDVEMEEEGGKKWEKLHSFAADGGWPEDIFRKDRIYRRVASRL